MSATETHYEAEVYLNARRRAAIAWVMMLLSMLTALVAVGAVIALAPLKETRPYVLMVNEETGAMQRLVQIQPMELAEDRAVIDANVVRYVIYRETYDAYDNHERIREVLRLSDATAREDLSAYWSDAERNPDHPDNVYGAHVRVKVRIDGVTALNASTVQVFLTRTRLQRNMPTVTSRSIATVGFRFDLGEVKTAEEAWANPLGFVVTNYRLDLQASSNGNTL